MDTWKKALEVFRESVQTRFGTIEWSETTTKAMNSYRSRWNEVANRDDPEDTGRIMTDLWDRLAMEPDDANTRLGLAQVGMELVFSLQFTARISGVPMSEVYESLGGQFYEIRAGRRVSYDVTNAAGERRKLTFERGERTMTLPGGGPVPSS